MTKSGARTVASVPHPHSTVVAHSTLHPGNGAWFGPCRLTSKGSAPIAGRPRSWPLRRATPAVLASLRANTAGGLSKGIPNPIEERGWQKSGQWMSKDGGEVSKYAKRAQTPLCPALVQW